MPSDGLILTFGQSKRSDPERVDIHSRAAILPRSLFTQTGTEKQTVAGKFEIYKDNAGEFRFRLKAGNGESIFASAGYKGKGGCENGIASVQKNGPLDERYERKESSNGKHYFVLKAGNHEVIGKSQMYESAASMENGIESVKKNSTTTNIDDQA